MAMGGVGEAMLLGAAMGGGSAALTGGDPLKGALLGGLTGGAGAGISGGLSALAPEAVLANAGTQAGAQAATQAGTQAATQAATQAGTQAATNLLPNAATTSGLPGALPNAATTLPGSANYALGAPSVAPGASGVNYALNAPTVAPGAGTSGISSLTPTTSAAPKTFTEGMARFADDPIASMGRNKFLAGSAALAGATGGRRDPDMPEEYDGPLKRYNWQSYRPAFAEGGITDLAAGGYDRMVGEMPMYPQAMARGGISDLGSYSDYARGGRMLKGPGDGMSDSIPASIGGKRPARLATEEFVVPADVVSHLGNGSSDAGAKQLYAMMDRVRHARTGRKSQGREINPQKYMVA